MLTMSDEAFHTSIVVLFPQRKKKPPHTPRHFVVLYETLEVYV